MLKSCIQLIHLLHSYYLVGVEVGCCHAFFDNLPNMDVACRISPVCLQIMEVHVMKKIIELCAVEVPSFQNDGNGDVHNKVGSSSSLQEECEGNNNNIIADIASPISKSPRDEVLVKADDLMIRNLHLLLSNCVTMRIQLVVEEVRGTIALSDFIDAYDYSGYSQISSGCSEYLYVSLRRINVDFTQKVSVFKIFFLNTPKTYL